MCVTVVQWSRSCLHVQIYRVRLPATLFSVSWYRFFFYLADFFKHYFSFWSFFLYSYCWSCWSCAWINILFQSFIFQKFLICILAKLTTRKKPLAVKTCTSSETAECFSMFVTSWQTTHSTPKTVLIYTIVIWEDRLWKTTNIKYKNNGAAVYVGSSLKVCTILCFLLANCDGIN